MSRKSRGPDAALMIAYTNYRTDPRVIRAAEAAVSAGFEVDFLALRREDDPPEETIRGVRVIHLNQMRYRGGGLVSYLAAYIEFFCRCLIKGSWLQIRRRYRLVHVNNIPDFLVFCALLPKLMGAKVLLDVHDPMPNTFASKFRSGENDLFFRLLLSQERLSASFADQVLTVHDPVRDLVLVKQHRLPADSVQVIANFPDDELFRLVGGTRFDGQLRLVFHGTILERYGLRDAMHAVSRTRNRENISVKIIGEGDFSQELKRLIESLGLSDTVQFDNRMYPLHEIPALLAGANLGLVPLELSSITNFALPLKLLEYLSMGIPSVTVRNAAIGYYFGEDDCLFYDPDDPGSLTGVLDRVVEDPDLLLHYRLRAVELRGNFAWSREKGKYMALVRQMSLDPDRVEAQ